MPNLSVVTPFQKDGANSFSDDGPQTGIFTLPMVNSRIYIVTSPALASQVQRAQKTLDFNSLVIEFTGLFVGLTSDARATLLKDVDSDDIEKNIILRMHGVQIQALSLGDGLDDMGKTQLDKMVEHIQQVDSGKPVELFQWLQEAVSKSNMYATYGPKNVFEQQPELVQAFFDYDTGLPFLMLGVAPTLLAGKAYAAREKLKRALAAWVVSGDYKTAAPWIISRIDHAVHHGFTLEQAGELELANIFGLLSNAMPSTFWVLAHVITSQGLMCEVRSELESSGIVTEADGGKTRYINMGKLRANCPLLFSIFRETLRQTALFASVRRVLEDTSVGTGDQQFLLKKGYLVQTSGPVIHNSQEVWGPDSQDFNPYRFYGNANGTKTSSAGFQRGKESIHPAAFRAFGGGSSLCPGRHFAQMEIMGLVALLLLGWEIEGADQRGLSLPKYKERIANFGVSRPETDLNIKIRRRKGLESMAWRFEKK